MAFYKKFIAYFLFALFLSLPGISNSLTDKIKNFFSFKVSLNIFDSINKDIKGKIVAKNIKFVLPNKIDINNIEVLDGNNQKVLQATRAMLSISLTSLLTKTITIQDIYLEKPVFHHTINNNIHNIIDVFEARVKSNNKQTKIRIDVEKVRLRGGHYEMVHEAGVRIFAKDIDADGKFSIIDDFFLINLDKVSIFEGSIFLDKVEFPIKTLMAEKLEISPKTINTQKIVAYYEKSIINASGKINIDKELYDINAQIKAKKNLWPKGLKPLNFALPAFSADLTLSGKLEDPQIRASIRHEDTDLLALPIKAGVLEANVNLDEIQVIKSTIKVGDIGEIHAQGKANLKNNTQLFNANFKNISLVNLSQFLTLKDIDAKGLISGKFGIEGHYSNKEHKFYATANGELQNAKIEELNFYDQTLFDTKFNFSIDNYVQINYAKISDKKGLLANITGNINIDKKTFFINLDAHAKNANKYIPKLGDLGNFVDLKTKGIIEKTASGIQTRQNVYVKKFNFLKDEVENISLELSYKNNQLKLMELKANISDGNAIGDVKIDNFSTNKLLSGYIEIKNFHCELLSKYTPSLELNGIADINVNLDGTLKSPLIMFSTDISNLNLNKIFIGKTKFFTELSNNNLIMKNISIKSEALTLFSKQLEINLKDKSINGMAQIDHININKIFKSAIKNINGELNGNIYLSGTLNQPHLYAPLNAYNLDVLGLNLGSGPATISFGNKELIGENKLNAQVFSLVLELLENEAKSSMRFAYALDKKTINVEANFSQLKINSKNIVDTQNSGFLGMEGKISGYMYANGPILAPMLNSEIKINEYSFFDPRHDKDSFERKIFSKAIIKADINNQILNFLACADLENQLSKNDCFTEGSFNFSLNGPFTFNEYSLNLTSSLNIKNIENILISLKKDLINANIKASFEGELRKTINQNPKYNIKVNVLEAKASLPNMPNINLDRNFIFTIADNNISIEKDLIANFYPGQLTLGGNYKKSKMNFNLFGSVPLIIARLFTPSIERIDGMAEGKISLTGSINEPIMDGEIKPDPKTIIKFKKWLEPISFKEGKVSFKKNSESSFSTHFENIFLNIGDGTLLLKGIFNKNYGTLKKSSINLFLDGSNILLRNGNDFVEIDFKLNTTVQQSSATLLKGNINISNGSAFRQFDLRNFVAEAKGPKPFSMDFLNNIDTKLDVDISINQFNASARIFNFYLDSSLSGQLKLQQIAKGPKLTGTININSGVISCPSTDFPLMNTVIELDETSAKFFDPKINIVATQVLEKSEFRIDEDTNIELSLKGDLDKINLSLKPLDGVTSLSQFAIFLLLLSPRYGSKSNAGLQNVAKDAALAFSGELFLRPFTNELQSLLEGKTNTRIQFGSAFEPGGISMLLNWKIGPRIELQGSYLFSGNDINISPLDKENFTLERNLLGDLKIILFLFDHRPFGPLFLENSFGAYRKIEGTLQPQNKISLRYRLIGQ